MHLQSKKQFSRMSMFLALAMIFSYVEFLLPLPIAIPGVKLGLANLVIMIPLYLWGLIPALTISLMRIVLVGITFGSLATMLYSLAGAVLSMVAMNLARKQKAFSITGVSVIGGICHNIGQLLVAIWVVQTTGLFYYLPILMIAGALTGLLIGILSANILERLKNLDKC